MHWYQSFKKYQFLVIFSYYQQAKERGILYLQILTDFITWTWQIVVSSEKEMLISMEWRARHNENSRKWDASVP